jgi:FtsZ-binding cell division protein ZapB
MNFKIKKIILWPKDISFEKKEIEFELEKVNVIVGDSQTGKSSIIPIIDYCLCSSRCTIPVGPIRKSTGWFGILVVTGDSEILLVREEPGANQSTSKMYFEEGKSIVIPERIIEANRNSEQVSRRINQLCKLPSLDFSEDSSNIKPYESRPSFKDFLAFNFQSQHIIANPYTLFYQADTIDHKLKLRNIFPLALGLIQANTLEIQRRIANLNDQLKEKRIMLSEKLKIRNAWEFEIRGNYVKALQLGILKDTPFPEESWKLEDFLVYLQEVPNLIKRIQYPILKEGITNRVVKYTAKVQKNEQEILDKLEEKSHRLTIIRNFKNSSTDYELAIKNQHSRLEPVNNGWLLSKVNKLENCPVCGSTNNSANENVKTLIKIADSVKEKISQISDSKDILDKEITETEVEIQELEKQLNNTRNQLEALGRENDSLERQRNSVEEIYRYVGKIEQNLKNIDETKIDSELAIKIQELEEQIKKLQLELNSENSLQNRDLVMKRISQAITFYKRILKVEEAENPTEIDEKQLTLKITSKDNNRIDYLWEIGSGSNWMGYHISTILALHEHFLSLKAKNHTPTFIIFDQPSQAYFPESVKNDEAKQLERSSDDLDRVKAIFVAFSDFMKRTKLKSQIIVLEHASSEFWGSVELTHQVDNKRWINGDALIPDEWIVQN